MQKIDSSAIPKLKEVVLNQNEPIAKRMRAVFTLRNFGGDASVEALVPGMYINNNGFSRVFGRV